MSRIVKNVSVLIRAEQLIARQQLNVLRRQTELVVLAALAAGFAVAAINVGVFFLIAPPLGNVGAAFALAGGNALIAVALILIARAERPGPDMTAAEELRDVAMSELEDEVNGIIGGLTAARNDPLGTLAPGLASAVVAAVLKARHKNDPDGGT